MLTDAELLAKLKDTLSLVDRGNYECSDDLAVELVEELEHLITLEQAYSIADIVDEWWNSQE